MPVSPAYGYAPSPGVMQIDSGITQAPSTSPGQMSQLQGIFKGMGLGQPGSAGGPSGALSPSAAGVGSPTSGNGVQTKAAGDAFNMLSRQQGAVLGNTNQNQMNVNEAQLSQNQAGAAGNIGVGAEKNLSDQYGNYLGLLGEGNTAVVNNNVAIQQQLAGLMNQLLGGALGTATGGGGLNGIASGSFGSNFGIG